MFVKIGKFLLLFFIIFIESSAFGQNQEKDPPVLHSHNDYEQERPLLDALQDQFESVEADIWWSNGEVKVSHLGFIFTGTLEALYLRPLFERVKSMGSVYGNHKTFYLWLDFKENSSKLQRELSLLLKQYMILFKNNGTIRPVQLILTGDHQGKKAFLRESFDFPIETDQEDFSKNLNPEDTFSWYSLDWRAIRGKEHFQKLVKKIHEQGKKVRFYATPDKPSFWNEAVQAGVDMIGTDEIRKLRDFIDKKQSLLLSQSKKRKPEWLRTLNAFEPLFQGTYSAFLFRN